MFWSICIIGQPFNHFNISNKTSDFIHGKLWNPRRDLTLQKGLFLAYNDNYGILHDGTEHN